MIICSIPGSILEACPQARMFCALQWGVEYLRAYSNIDWASALSLEYSELMARKWDKTNTFDGQDRH